MRTTNKLFWVLWSLTQVVVASSCVYDTIMMKSVDDASFVFLICQPLMVLLYFFHKRHLLEAVIYMVIVSICAIYSCWDRFNSGGEFLDGWNWFVYLSLLSVFVFLLLGVHWSIERIIKVCKSKSSKDSAD